VIKQESEFFKLPKEAKMTTERKICQTCANWEINADQPSWGWCAMMSVSNGQVHYSQTLAFTEADDGWVNTHEEFGCIMWETKKLGSDRS
jgi:hypothetical protein